MSVVRLNPKIFDEQSNFTPKETYGDRVLLFLDFDGVLHPYESGHTRIDMFGKLSLLEWILRDLTNVEVVVSSSWGKNHSLSELKECFSPDVRSRVIGSIKQHTDSRRADVLKYLQTRGEIDAIWIAVDDMAFYEPTDPIVWTNHKTGLTTITATTLRNALTSPLEFKEFVNVQVTKD